MAEFNLVQAVFDRSLLSPNEDVGILTMHIRKHIALAPDVGPITDVIRDDFTSKFTTFFNVMKTMTSSKLKLSELRYYDVPPGPGIDMGPPKKVATLNLLGTSNVNALPPQVALSVTFKTALRKHWGRFYWPGLVTTVSTPTGRMDAVTCQTISTAAAALCNKAGTGANLTVFSRSLWNDQEVTQVQVDDIFDVIRRRRFSLPTTRAVASP